MRSFDITKEFSGKEVRTSVLESYLHLYTKEGWRVVGEEPRLAEEESEFSGDAQKPLDHVVDETQEKTLNIEDVFVDKKTPALNYIHASQSKEQVVQFMLEEFQTKIDMRGTLDTVKEKAKAVINESKRVD